MILWLLRGATLTKTGNGTFRVSGGNMDIAENAIVFGDATLTFTRKLEMKAGSNYEWELGESANDQVSAATTEVASDGAWTPAHPRRGGQAEDGDAVRAADLQHARP